MLQDAEGIRYGEADEGEITSLQQQSHRNSVRCIIGLRQQCNPNIGRGKWSHCSIWHYQGWNRIYAQKYRCVCDAQLSNYMYCRKQRLCFLTLNTPRGGSCLGRRRTAKGVPKMRITTATAGLLLEGIRAQRVLDLVLKVPDHPFRLGFWSLHASGHCSGDVRVIGPRRQINISSGRWRMFKSEHADHVARQMLIREPQIW